MEPRVKNKKRPNRASKIMELYSKQIEKTKLPLAKIKPQAVTSLPEISPQGIIYAYRDPDVPDKIRKTRAQTDRDNQFIIQQYLLNVNPLDIAIALNEHLHGLGENYQVTKYSVQNRIKEWRLQREEDNKELIQDYFVKELAKLNADEIELTRLWNKSKESKMEVEYEGYPTESVDADDIKLTRPDTNALMIKKAIVTDSCGDQGIYDQILKVRDKRAKLLGYDRPEIVQNILLQYTPKQQDISETMSPEMLIRMASMMQGFGGDEIANSEEVK